MGQGADAVARGGQYPRPPVCRRKDGRRQGRSRAPGRHAGVYRLYYTQGRVHRTEAGGNPAGRRVLPGRRGPPAGGAGRSVAQAQ